jgi:mRNA-degrading endonuclease toxin of MazEF toxin-antitoxin module
MTARSEDHDPWSKTVLLVEQLRTVDKDYLGDAVGHLPAHEMRNLDVSIKLVLGLF